MQLHSKGQQQVLIHLQTQYEAAVTAIKNNNQLSDEEKQKALKEEKNQYIQKKRGLQGSLFAS